MHRMQNMDYVGIACTGNISIGGGLLSCARLAASCVCIGKCSCCSDIYYILTFRPTAKSPNGNWCSTINCSPSYYTIQIDEVHTFCTFSRQIKKKCIKNNGNWKKEPEELRHTSQEQILNNNIDDSNNAAINSHTHRHTPYTGGSMVKPKTKENLSVMYLDENVCISSISTTLYRLFSFIMAFFLRFQFSIFVVRH